MLFVAAFASSAAEPADEVSTADALPDDLLDLSIEELMDINISLVSRKAEPLRSAPAAVYVVTGDDLRRTGVTTIPDALRMVPGLQVAQVDANKWAISSRGFNGRFANKLLVQIDGRTVYTPLYSGVFWDVQELMLEDVDRIEVVRGPGAALWGANAVNGIINIVTKKTHDTQGGVLVVSGGMEERITACARYGGKIGRNTHYRVYAKGFDRDDFADASGGDAHDKWDGGLIGFRADSDLLDGESLTVQGHGYVVDYDEVLIAPVLTPPYSETVRSSNRASGHHLLAGWTREHDDGNKTTVRGYWDHAVRDSSVLDFTQDVLDIDLQHAFPLGTRQSVTWGLGYRYLRDDIDGTFTVSLEPGKRRDDVFSAFLQDQIAVIGDDVDFTLGTKVEHNDYTGFEVQPSARARWRAGERATVWGAVSRAVRTPSRVEHDGSISRQVLSPGTSGTGLSTAISLFGNDDYDTEELLAYEIGYRFAAKAVSIDVATFYDDYDDLRTLEAGQAYVDTASGLPYLVLPFGTANKMSGHTYGLETAVSWRPFDWWLIKGSHTWLRMFLDMDGDSTDTISESDEDGNPTHQFSLQSSMNPTSGVELDTVFRYVDDVPSLNVDSYVELDVRIGWQCTESLELSLVGRNLLDGHHPEYASEIVEYVPSEVERSVYAKATWRF